MNEVMPVFAIKGKDALAVPALRAYARECRDHGLDHQVSQVDHAIDEVRLWQANYPELTKLPDHYHVPAGRPGSGSEG